MSLQVRGFEMHGRDGVETEEGVEVVALVGREGTQSGWWGARGGGQGEGGWRG